MKKLFTLFLFAALFEIMQGKTQNCDSIILNTGYNQITSSTYNIGDLDLYWKITNVPTNCNTGFTPVNPSFVIAKDGAWTLPYPNSQWLSFRNNSSFTCDNRCSVTTETYDFEFKFCVLKADSFKIKFNTRFDNSVCAFVDAMSIPLTPIQLPNTPINFSTVPGINCPTCNNWNDTKTFSTAYETRANFNVYLSTGTHKIIFKLRNNSGVAIGLNVEGSIKPLKPSAGILACTKDCVKEALISVHKILDKNCNNSIDPGEDGGNWQFNITGPNFNQTITTDNTGYAFSNVLTNFGSYTISEIPQPGWHSSNPNSGLYTINVLNGQSNQLTFFNCPGSASCCPVFRPTNQDTINCNLQFNYIQQPACNDSILNIKINLANGVFGNSGITSGCSTLNFNPSSYVGASMVTLVQPCTGPGLGFIKMDLDAIDCTKPITAALIITMKNGKVCEYTGELKCPCPKSSSCCPLINHKISYCPPENSVKHCKITINDVNPNVGICNVQISYSPNPGTVIPTGLMINGSSSGSLWNANSIPVSGNFPNLPYVDLLMFGLTVNANYTGTTDIKVTLCDGTICSYKFKWKTQSITAEPVNIIIGKPKLQAGSVLTAHTLNLIIDRDLDKPLSAISIGWDDSTEVAKNHLETFAMSGAIHTSGSQSNYLFPAQSSWQTKGSWLWEFDTITMLKNKEMIGFNIVYQALPNTKNKLRYVLLDQDGEILNGGTAEVSSANGSVITSILDNKNNSLSEEMVSLYPNPTNNLININYDVIESGEMEIWLLSNFGSRIKLIENRNNALGWHTTQLSTIDLPEGVYFIEVKSKHGSAYKKFVVVK